jgi:DNA repair protein RecO (recombination protein O)
VALIETEAVVLRTLRYGESDAILTLLTPGAGRVSAIAKGARKPTSRQGGRLQPGVRLQASLVQGRGDLLIMRSSQVVDAGAGLWMDGYRLRAAGCVLEVAMRVVPEDEEAEAAYNLTTRALALISTAAPREGQPRFEPYVLGMQAKLLAASGLVPHLASCAACGGPAPLVGFAATAGGAVCPACTVGSGAEALDPDAADALVALLARPLADARECVEPAAAAGVERIIALMLREHLGVTLKSGTPLEVTNPRK